MTDLTEIAGSSERLNWPQGHNMQPTISIPMATEDGGAIVLFRLETWVAGPDGQLRHFTQIGRVVGEQIWPVMSQDDFGEAIRQEEMNYSRVVSTVGLDSISQATGALRAADE